MSLRRPLCLTASQRAEKILPFVAEGDKRAGRPGAPLRSRYILSAVKARQKCLVFEDLF